MEAASSFSETPAAGEEADVTRHDETYPRAQQSPVGMHFGMGGRVAGRCPRMTYSSAEEMSLKCIKQALLFLCGEDHAFQPRRHHESRMTGIKYFQFLSHRADTYNGNGAYKQTR